MNQTRRHTRDRWYGQPRSPRWTTRYLCAAACAVVTLGSVDAAHARMRAPAGVAAMTRSAARVFRGHCLAAEVGTAEVGGARIPVTTYTFSVGEHLKGTGADKITFRQVGAPDGGARDMGRLVGLPRYAPGTEYVLFLLPESRAGLTSPAGTAEGALAVHGEQVQLFTAETAGAPAYGGRTVGAAEGPQRIQTISYEALRHTVLDEVNR